MDVGFLSVVIHAAHPSPHVDVTHPLSCDRRLVQNNILRVPDYYTQFISTDKRQQDRLIRQHGDQCYCRHV